MFKFPFKLRRNLANARLEDFRGKSIGTVASHVDSMTSQVFDASGQLQGILQFENRDFTSSIQVSLLNNQHQVIGRLEVANVYGSMFSRLRSEIYVEAEKTPRYFYTEDSLLLRITYNILEYSEHVLSIFQGYLMHPSYTLHSTSGKGLIKLTKEGSFLEGSCRVETIGTVRSDEIALLVMASLALAQVDYDIKTVD